MEPTKYIWKNGELLKWEDAMVHCLTHTMHYGSGAFEGIRCYAGEQGSAIFRLPEHIDRLIYSAKAIGMEVKYSRDELIAATVKTVAENDVAACYIRPLVYYGYGIMGLNPRTAPVDVIIACWPWGAYLPHDMVDLKVSSYIRIHPKSTVADAKVVGHYVNSTLSVLELRGTKYHESLLLDYKGHVAEGPGENFFMVKNGKLLTPQLGTILNGITRATIMEVARNRGIEVVETDITLEEAQAADEAFYTGTAAEIMPIRSIQDKVIGSGTLGPITEALKTQYLNIVNGRDKEYQKFLTLVKK